MHICWARRNWHNAVCGLPGDSQSLHWNSENILPHDHHILHIVHRWVQMPAGWYHDIWWGSQGRILIRGEFGHWNECDIWFEHLCSVQKQSKHQLCFLSGTFQDETRFVNVIAQVDSVVVNSANHNKDAVKIFSCRQGSVRWLAAQLVSSWCSQLASLHSWLSVKAELYWSLFPLADGFPPMKELCKLLHLGKCILL